MSVEFLRLSDGEAEKFYRALKLRTRNESSELKTQPDCRRTCVETED
jgi:hypothetical protein